MRCVSSFKEEVSAMLWIERVARVNNGFDWVNEREEQEGII